jgi:hypothetical protein
MNSKHLIIASIVLFGSLWGLAELGLGELAWANSIPRAAILTAIGVIFLVLGRACGPHQAARSHSRRSRPPSNFFTTRCGDAR